ncbi:MAG: DUF1476 domain-containing protein [Neomegalonema sp.]|nr:DUF1476 domain-containing protein [Neomegalonema sp.]
MSTFDDREKAFENKFAHDEQMQFKAAARRNKKLGLWAAAKLGLSDEQAAEYAKAVVVADLEEVGEDDVFRKVFHDLTEKGVAIEETELRVKMAELMVEAKGEIITEH